MNKILIISTVLFLSVSAQAGLMDVYNKIDTNTSENSTYVDQKAAALKKKIQDKTDALTQKYETASISEQETAKSKLEKKLEDLKSKGESKSQKAKELQAEIDSLNKLIEAAQQ